MKVYVINHMSFNEREGHVVTMTEGVFSSRNLALEKAKKRFSEEAGKRDWEVRNEKKLRLFNGDEEHRIIEWWRVAEIELDDNDYLGVDSGFGIVL